MQEKSKLVKELTSIITRLPNETLEKLIKEYKSQAFNTSDDIFLVDYRIVSFNTHEMKISVLEYVDGEYVKTVDQKTIILDKLTPIRVIDRKPQFISYEDDENHIYRWIYDGEKFVSSETKIKTGNANFLDMNGNIFTITRGCVKKYSKTNELIQKVGRGGIITMKVFINCRIIKSSWEVEYMI